MKARRGTKGEVIQARVITAKKQMLDRYAEAQHQTTSEIVRKLIDEYIRVIERKIATGEIQVLPDGTFLLRTDSQLSYTADSGVLIGSK